MENVTEELVRQNGNQAAAVMADYAGQGGGGGGGSTSVSGVVIQGGSIVNNVSPRPATEADVAKFTGGGVVVNSIVIEINGVVPYALQAAPSGNDPVMMLLSSLILSEHSVYYAQSGVESEGADADFKIVRLLISDDATLLAFPNIV